MIGESTLAQHGSLRGPSAASASASASRNDNQRRPIMYTFFDALPTTNAGESAGMSTKAHDTMISVWQESWQQAGWQTETLTMAHAKQHPEFEIFEAKIKNFTMSEYDKLCYYRWLAMAAVGGGWMSGTSMHNETLYFYVDKINLQTQFETH